MSWKQKIKQFVEEDNKKIVFLINAREGLDYIADYLKEVSRDLSASHPLVFFGLEISDKFSQLNSKIKTSEDYLTKGDYEAIDKYVFEELSRSWYFYKDATDYGGISLGQISEYDFQKYLTPRIKNLKIIRRIVEKENIQKIVSIDDTGELNDVAKLYGKINNLQVLEVRLSQNEKTSFALNLKSKSSDFLCGLLDRLALKRALRFKQDKGLALIDARLYNTLGCNEDDGFLLRCLLEQGVGTRLNLIKRGSPYISLCYTKKRCYSKDWVEFKKRWENLRSDKDFRDIFKYEGIPIWEIVHRQLSAFFLESIPRVISNIKMLDAIIEKKKIKIAVLRNDVKELEKTVIFGLRLASVPSLVIQHGILAETNGHNVLFTDKYIAWGRASVEWYGRFGNAAERFEITGNPRFDILVNWKPKLTKQELCQRLNINENKGIILFATQQINKFSSFWTDDLFLVMADKLMKAMQQFPDKQLIVKVDPYEDVNPYRNRIRWSFYNNAVAIRDIDIYTLIPLSELVITLDSTVALEAMVFDKPVITLNLTKRKDRVPYAESGAAIGVYEEKGLMPAIRKALTDRETTDRLRIGRNEFLKEYAYAIDGKAIERISNLIKHYIEN